MNYIYLSLFLLVSCCITHVQGTIVNTKTIKQPEYIAPEIFVNNGIIETDSLSCSAKAINNGSIKTGELLVNGDFDSKNGSLTASKIFVTASCNVFNVGKNCSIQQLNFFDPATKIILGISGTKIISLNKGSDYMGGIECAFGRARQGKLTITNKEMKIDFSGPSEHLEKALNEGINTTNSVVALIAYLTKKLANSQ